MTAEMTEPIPRPRRPHADKRPTERGPTVLPGVPAPVGRAVEGLGDFLRFTLTSIALIPQAVRLYPSEVFRHAGILIRGSSLVVLFMALNLGVLGSILLDSSFEPLGVQSLTGAGISVGVFRGAVPIITGWIVAAKVGCGIVTELGAMRITEEIDALEVMGLNPKSYLVSSRLAAAALTLPGLVLVSYWMMFLGAFVTTVPFLGSTSSGSFWRVLFQLQNLSDFFIVTVWTLLSVGIAVIVAAYYGYTATGGPVGVGESTAKSMLISMTAVAVLAGIIIQIAYGLDANSPIAN